MVLVFLVLLYNVENKKKNMGVSKLFTGTVGKYMQVFLFFLHATPHTIVYVDNIIRF